MGSVNPDAPAPPAKAFDVPFVSSASTRPPPWPGYIKVADDSDEVKIGGIPTDAMSSSGVTLSGLSGWRVGALDLARQIDTLDDSARPGWKRQPWPMRDELKVQFLTEVEQAPEGGAIPLLIGASAMTARNVIGVAYFAGGPLALGVSADRGAHVRAFKAAINPVANSRTRPPGYVLLSFGRRDARIANAGEGASGSGFEWHGAPNASEVAPAWQVASQRFGGSAPMWILLREDANYGVLVSILEALPESALSHLVIANLDPADRAADPAVAPRVHLGPPIVTGRVGRVAVADLFRRNRNKLAYCYDQVLRDRPDMRPGLVAVNVVIGGDGRARALWAIGFDPDVTGCVAEVARGYEFGHTADGRPLTVTYPLAFDVGSVAGP